MTRQDLAKELKSLSEYTSNPNLTQDEENALMVEVANRLACIASEIEHEQGFYNE